MASVAVAARAAAAKAGVVWAVVKAEVGGEAVAAVMVAEVSEGVAKVEVAASVAAAAVVTVGDWVAAVSNGSRELHVMAGWPHFHSPSQRPSQRPWQIALEWAEHEAH